MVLRILVGQAQQLNYRQHELVIGALGGCICLYAYGIALLHRVASRAPLNEPQTTFNQRDPYIKQHIRRTQVLTILYDEVQLWLNTAAACI